MKTTTSLRDLVKGLALAVSLTAALGCTKEVVTEKIVSGDNQAQQKDVRVEVNDKMSAEDLALAGEQLVSPATFMLAQKAFDMSLSKDPNNKRAQFYTAMLKPFMVYRGIAVRLKPVIRLHGDIAAHEKQIAKIPNSPFRDFIFDGKEDIKNIADAQSYVMEMQKAWNEARVFLVNNSNLNLTLNLNPYVFKREIETEVTESCRLEQVGGFACTSTPEGTKCDGQASLDNPDNGFTATCNWRNAAQRKVNAADVVALRQMISGYVMLFNIYTAYSFEGVDELMILDRDGRMTEEQKVRYVEDNLPEAGKLRKDNQLKQVVNLGSDIVAAMKWAVQYQTQLCPKGPHEDRQRPGFLFSNGFCVGDVEKTNRDIALIEQALKGAIDIVLTTPQGEQVQTKVDYLAWTRNPIQDLRSITPAAYNRCGHAASLKDKTMGGIYVNGDAEKFYLSPCAQ